MLRCNNLATSLDLRRSPLSFKIVRKCKREQSVTKDSPSSEDANLHLNPGHCGAIKLHPRVAAQDIQQDPNPLLRIDLFDL